MNTIIILSVVAIVTLFLGVFNVKKLVLPVAALGVVLAGVFTIIDWSESASFFNNMLLSDGFTSSFSLIMLGSTLLVILLGYQYYKESDRSLEDVTGVLLFSLIGALVMVGAGNLAMFFIGLEIMSISLYVLAASNKTSNAGNEAAMKYFLMGSFASAFLLFGIALVYGGSGSLYNQAIYDYTLKVSELPLIVKAGIILIVAGLAFKIAAAPFHFWAPDVYQGSPTIITTFMVSAVKVAGFAAFFRLAQTVFPASVNVWTNSVAVMALLSIIIGNFTALYQTDAKRMLAYSSVSHTGYILLALVAFNNLSTKALVIFSISYVLANIAAFATLIVVKQSKGSTQYEAFNGLGKQNKLMALGLTFAMLSLTGIPPLAGFIAKYYVFVSAIQSGWLWLVLIALLGSVVSIFYYFRPLINAWFREGNSGSVKVELTTSVVVIVCILALLVFGISVNWL